MHIHAVLPSLLRAGQPLQPATPWLNWDGTRGSRLVDAGWMGAGHARWFSSSWPLIRARKHVYSASVHFWPCPGYVPVPPVPQPASLLLRLRLVELTCCLSPQLCSFNNLLGTHSRRTGQAAWCWPGIEEGERERGKRRWKLR